MPLVCASAGEKLPTILNRRKKEKIGGNREEIKNKHMIFSNKKIILFRELKDVSL